MNTRRMVLSAVSVPLLGGCMMGPFGHGGWTEPPRRETAHAEQLRHAEARSGDLAISLSFPTATTAVAVPMEARLGTSSHPYQPIEAEVWLRVETPRGSRDELRMQRLDSPAGPTYHATYSFRTPGAYLVTAEGRPDGWNEACADCSVSVTTKADVAPVAYGRRGHDWLMPMAVLGGVAMVVMMVVMMGS